MKCPKLASPGIVRNIKIFNYYELRKCALNYFSPWSDPCDLLQCTCFPRVTWSGNWARLRSFHPKAQQQPQARIIDNLGICESKSSYTRLSITKVFSIWLSKCDCISWFLMEVDHPGSRRASCHISSCWSDANGGGNWAVSQYSAVWVTPPPPPPPSILLCKKRNNNKKAAVELTACELHCFLG